ncbi:ABC transporter ATP-binding protein [Dictyobacter sp. S3.2.2.5]|uniref:ABC transporter ATP-binding protein n=1 Tax=Dictyobacter halimunensis TaxID=3026934 RepID=A0ABQ6FJS7_9CHLR|nr:ABC transporter ATP-binding protein [Dictyobacter sp. S3.2.2.5]
MLKVEQLHAGYGSLEVLHGVSFEVAQGSIVAILGSNGAGKTTLMRALSGLIPVKSGRVEFAGQPLGRLSAEKRLREGLALVPEGRDLFGSLTVRENLVMGAYTRRSRAEMEQDIERILDLFPRLKERLHAHAASLSGGEGQMLAIGRALMSHPRLLLLDEPSQGLAPIIVETVFDVIEQLNKAEGLTIVLVEQNAHQALEVAHDAYILQGGSIVLNGEATTLTANSSVQELYMGG